MPSLVVTTIRRKSPAGMPSGYVYTVDVETEQVIGRCPIIEPRYLDEDPNPRGGLRGGKGIAIWGNDVFIANHSAIFRFDSTWKVKQVFSHPSCAHIHDLRFHHRVLWVTSTRNDLLVAFDLKGSLVDCINVRTEADLLRSVGWRRKNLLSEESIRNGAIDFRDPRSHLFEKFDGTHLNSVCFLPNGDMLFALGLLWTRKKAVMQIVKNYLQNTGLWSTVHRGTSWLKKTSITQNRIPKESGVLNPRSKSVIIRKHLAGPSSVAFVVNDTSVPIHSIETLPDGTVVFDDTNTGDIVHIDPDSRGVLSRTNVTRKYLRGLTRIDEKTLVVGCQRDLCLFDLAECQKKGTIRLSDNSNESVYAVKVLPRETGPLPKRLAD